MQKKSRSKAFSKKEIWAFKVGASEGNLNLIVENRFFISVWQTRNNELYIYNSKLHKLTLIISVAEINTMTEQGSKKKTCRFFAQQKAAVYSRYPPI